MSKLVNQLKASEQLRQTVLSVAFPLFARQGFSETQLEDIARAAGLPLAVVEQEFPLKIDILICKLIYADRTRWEIGYRALFKRKDPVEAIYGYCTLVVEHFLDTLGLPLCRELILQLQWGLNGESKQRYAPIYDHIRDHVGMLLQHLKSQNALNPDTDVASTAQVVTDVSHSFCARLLQEGSLKLQRSGVSAREAIRLFFLGIRAL